MSPFHLKINCVLINEINAFIDAGNLMTDDDDNDDDEGKVTYTHIHVIYIDKIKKSPCMWQ